MNCKAFMIIIGLLTPILTLSQSTNLGTPFIHNYIKQDYKAGTQTWDILQTKDGRMYFANNDGLLEFDGNHWRTFPLPNRSILRSIELGKDGKIYCGGQNEIGYFAPDENGILIFHSLMEKIPEEHRQFGEVWHIVVTKNYVFFGTSSKMYLYENNQFKVLPNQNGIDFSGKLDNEIFIHNTKIGLQKWDFKNSKQPQQLGFFAGKRIRGFLQTAENTYLIATEKNGFFKYSDNTVTPFTTTFDNFLKNNRIQSSTILGGDKVAIGTAVNGLVIMDFEGKAIQHITKQNGLQLNNVRIVFTDNQQDLWLGLDNGIDFIQTSTPYSMVFPDLNLEGAGFAAIDFKEKIYFGTSNGVFYKDWKDYYDPFDQEDFKLVNNTSGQVWGLSKIEDHLFIGHNDGAFEIIEHQVKTIFADPSLGSWTFLPFQENPNKLLIGTYNGLKSIEKINSKWDLQAEAPDFYESSRIIVKAKNGDFWMSHPYRGVYKFKLNIAKNGISEIQYYNENKGLPSNFLNHVFNIHNQILVGGEMGVFIYDNAQDKFLPFEKMNSIFGKERVVRLIEDKAENIWFVTESEIGYLNIKDKGVQKDIEKITLPNINSKLVGGFEFIYPLDDSNVFIGAEKGFIHYDKTADLQKVDTSFFKVNFNKIQVTGDHYKTLFGGHFTTKKSDQPILEPVENSIHFSYSSTDYQNPELIEYQYFLEGSESHFSEWSGQIEKEYTNLTWGEYTFKVRARNASGMESELASYSFEISPPWYATKMAYGIYGLLILGGLLSLILIPQRQFKKEKAQLESEHQIEVEKSERQIVELKNENLESEIQHQNQILASTTMHLVQKSEMLQKLKSEIAKAAKNAVETENRKDLNRLVRMIDQDARLDEDWEQFSLFFDKVHDNFTQKLREKYPKLTPKDHKLCAYLRMNLNTKEIAPLLNISVRGVEISRYRLRKKLEVPTGDNLIEFINKI